MINKLVEKIKKTGAPIVVGLDPMLNYIPQHVLDKAYAEYGETLEGAAEAVWPMNDNLRSFLQVDALLFFTHNISFFIIPYS